MGFYLESVTLANEKSCNPKILLHDSHVSSDNGEVLWYPEPYFKSGTVNGTFRHRDCKRVGKFDGGVCSACKSIPKIDSFRLKLQRRRGKDGNQKKCGAAGEEWNGKSG